MGTEELVAATTLKPTELPKNRLFNTRRLLLSPTTRFTARKSLLIKMFSARVMDESLMNETIPERVCPSEWLLRKRLRAISGEAVSPPMAAPKLSGDCQLPSKMLLRIEGEVPRRAIAPP